MYVYNHPLEAKPFIQNGRAYVPVKPLAKALNLAIQEKEDGLWLGTPPQQKVDGKVILNGKSFTQAFQSDDKEWFVDLEAFAAATGNKVMINQQTGIVDVLPGSTETISQKQAEASTSVNAAPVFAVDLFTYRNEKQSFSIKYLKSWEKLENIVGASVAFRRPKENKADLFLENLNVVVENLPEEKISLDQYNQAALKLLKKALPSIQLVETSQTTLAGTPAVQNIYTYHDAGPNLRLMQVYTLSNNKAYVISYTATDEHFQKYLPLIQEMLGSFEIH